MKSNLNYQINPNTLSEPEAQALRERLRVYHSSPRQRLIARLSHTNYRLAFCLCLVFVYNGLSYYALSGIEGILHTRYTELNESIKNRQELEVQYSRESSWEKLYSIAKQNNMQTASQVKTLSYGM